MEPVRPYRPRVSRETRLLVISALVSLAALWGLARIRFSDPMVGQSMLPPILTPLVSAPSYDDLTAEPAQALARARASLVHLAEEPSARVALRVRRDVAVVMLPPMEASVHDADLVARDEVSGLAVVRVPEIALDALLVSEAVDQPQLPRYLMATDVFPGGVSLRPVYVGAMATADAPTWSAEVWTVPGSTDIAPGDFLFTNDGDVVGLVIAHRGLPAIVRMSTVLREADRLIEASGRTTGDLGVQVQALTPPLARATASERGVIVAWVDPAGPSSNALTVGDVIDAVNGKPVPTLEHWQREAAQLTSAIAVSVRVRRRGETRDVTLVPATASPQGGGAGDRQTTVSRSGGLQLRARRGEGSEVTGIDGSSPAARAGVVVGDVITSVGDVGAPTPAQVRRVIAGTPVLVGVRRGTSRHLLVIER